MMDSVRDWNRANIPGYFEIYLRAPLDILVKRDQKNLYSRALKGELSNVVGIDIAAEEPKNPDMLIDNDGSERLEKIADRIIDALGTF
jgi:adenylylsulfate kinase-like enzyme